MALSNKGSYIPTTNEFLAHWALADLAVVPDSLILAAEPGVIPAGFNRSGLVVLRDTLQDNLDAVQAKLNVQQVAQGLLDISKAVAYRRLELFLALLDGYYANTEFFAARPVAPGMGAGEEKFLSPLRDVKSLWTMLNGATAPAGVTLPIVLDEGTEGAPSLVTLAQFISDLDVLRARYENRSVAEQGTRLARSTRDKTMGNIRAVLVAYRAAAQSKLQNHPALLDTLPRVTPLPGHTPDKVTISAVFQAPDTAEVTHSESADTDFKEYQLRGTVGDDGDTEDAVVLATHTARTPAPFTTTLGLGVPGGAVIALRRDGVEAPPGDGTMWLRVRCTDASGSAHQPHQTRPHHTARHHSSTGSL